MTGSIKGLLKGLRYIAQIFDSKQEEMQIGLPTDVKHVAHIGWDGSSTNPPTWMNGFQSVPELTTEPSNTVVESKKPAKKFTSEGTQESKNEKPRNKPRRKTSPGTGSPLNSPKQGSDGTKQSRNHFASNTALDSPRGNQKSNLSIESSSHNPAGIPKQSRRKKSKGSSYDGSSTKSSGTDSGQRMKNKQRYLSSVLEENEEEKG